MARSVCVVTPSCQDSVKPANLEPLDPTMEPQFGPLYGERFIAQVSDGTLVGFARVMLVEDDPPAGSSDSVPQPLKDRHPRRTRPLVSCSHLRLIAAERHATHGRWPAPSHQ